jgi:hypothetical protein
VRWGEELTLRACLRERKKREGEGDLGEAVAEQSREKGRGCI